MPTFSGGVTNGGAINATHDGIAVEGISSFAGGITNSGTVTATNFNAIQVNDTTAFSGGITNSGKLSGNEAGIFLSDVPTFQGVISNGNTGVITAQVGIFASNALRPSACSITGAITGTSGTIAGNHGISFDQRQSKVTLIAGGFTGSGDHRGNELGVGIFWRHLAAFGGTGHRQFRSRQ